MTFRERLAIEHPDAEKTESGYPYFCPMHYGYENSTFCSYYDSACADCWDREAPPRKVKVMRIVTTLAKSSNSRKVKVRRK